MEGGVVEARHRRRMGRWWVSEASGNIGHIKKWHQEIKSAGWDFGESKWDIAAAEEKHRELTSAEGGG